MKLKDLKQGMICKLRNKESIIVINNSGYVLFTSGFLRFTQEKNYNKDLTHKRYKNLDIMEVTYGDKLVFERVEKTPADWKPEYGENYYAVRGDCVLDYEWENDDIDSGSFSTERLFKTKAEAEKHLEWKKAKRSIELEIARLNEGWEPDWENDKQAKYSFFYAHSTDKLITTRHYEHQVLGFYLKTEELAEQLIESHERELKIYFEVEE